MTHFLLFICLLGTAVLGCKKDEKDKNELASSEQVPDSQNTPSGDQGVDPGVPQGASNDQVEAAFREGFATFESGCRSNPSLLVLPRSYTGFDNNNNFPGISAAIISCPDDLIAQLTPLVNALVLQLPEEAEAIFQEASLDLSDFLLSEASSISFELSEGLVDTGSGLDSGIVVVKFASGSSGDASINFSYMGSTQTTSVTTYEYTQDQIAAGKDYYTSPGKCGSCHVGQENSADHSANRISACSDTSLVGAITLGEYASDPNDPEGLCAGYTLEAPNHMWTFADEAERSAVIAFLRTLPLEKGARDMIVVSP